MRSCYESAEKRYVIGTREPVSFFVKLRANRQKTKDKLGPEIGFVMA